MFVLSEEEIEIMVSQNVTPSKQSLGGAYPFAFTDMGVAMLSSVLKGKRAIDVNIAIMRAFIALKQFALTNTELSNKLKELESTYNKQFKDVY